MIPFDDAASWDDFCYKLRVLSEQGATCYIQFRMVNGRIHRKTLKQVNDLAQCYINRIKEEYAISKLQGPIVQIGENHA